MVVILSKDWNITLNWPHEIKLNIMKKLCLVSISKEQIMEPESIRGRIGFTQKLIC